MRGRVGVGALGIIDEQHVAAAADLLHAMGEAGKAAQAILKHVEADAHGERSGGGAGRVLRVVEAAQQPMPPSAATWLQAPPAARTMVPCST